MSNFFNTRQFSLLTAFCVMMILVYACSNGQAEEQPSQQNTSSATSNTFSGDPDNFNVLLLPFHPDKECKPENLKMEKELISLVQSSQWAKAMMVDIQLLEGEECPFKPQIAHEIGREHKADVVVWGFYNPKKQKPEILYAWINDAVEGHMGLPHLADLRNGFYLKDDVNYIGNWLIGVAAMSQGKWAEAITALQYVPVDKCDVAITPLMIHSYYSIHKEKEVDSLLNIVMTCVPKYVGLAMRGWRQHIGGKYQEAFKDYSEAIKLNQKYRPAYEHRATLLFERKKFKEAIADFTNAINLGSDEESVFSTRGIAYHNSGDREKAIEDYTRVLKLNSNNAKAYFDRGNAHYILGHYDEALKDYTMGISKEPSTSRAYLNRGITYVELDNYEAAIADLTHVLKEQPENITALAYRGAAYSFHGKLEEAGLDFVNTLALDPDNQMAIRGREYLESVKEQKNTADELDRLKREAKTERIIMPETTEDGTIKFDVSKPAGGSK